MRQLVDEQGKRWRIDILFASYGTYYLVFSAEAAGEVRKLAMGADSQRDAAAALAAMDEQALGAALADASGFDERSPLGF